MQFVIVADVFLIVTQFVNKFFCILPLPMVVNIGIDWWSLRVVGCICGYGNALFLFILLNHAKQPRTVHFFQLFNAVNDKIGALHHLIDHGLDFLGLGIVLLYAILIF
jgi:hypothetical protein